MKKFIRENPTLAFGLGLPLVIVIVFLLAAVLPQIGAMAPKYPVVFATNYYPNNRGITIRIENRKAHVVYIGENNYYTAPKLYIYDPAKNTVREIPIVLPLMPAPKACCPNIQDSTKITPVSVPELEALTLDTSGIAPDGYELTNYYENYARDPFLGGFLFSGSSYQNGAALKKGGYKVLLPHTDGEYYTSAQFIGWVVP